MTSENIRALVEYRLEQADEFVKKGISPKELSRWLHGAFDLRQRSDYGADQAVSDSDAQRMLDNARIFVSRIYT